jgi:hypothetical protein
VRGARAAALLGVAVLLAWAAPASASIPRPGSFAGATSQTAPDGSPAPVRIEVTRGGRRLKSLDITWLAPCDRGFNTLGQVTHAKGGLDGRGRFAGGNSYRSAGGNLKGTQYTADIRDRLRGRFTSRARVRGTFRAVAVLRDAAGLEVSTCRSPLIRWTARRR